MRQKQKFKSEKGITIYLAVLLMGIILAIAFGLTTISLNQLKMIKSIGDSVIAFYAADTGIERALYDFYKDNKLPPNITYSNEDVGNNAFYSVESYLPSPDPGDPCPSADYGYYCIRSVGSYLGTRRAIEINR